MITGFTDDECCQFLIHVFSEIFPTLTIRGGAEEPFYAAPTEGTNAVLYFRGNYPRSLLHEISHYCLAGDRRRKLDDFGYWYTPCGRSEEEQVRFEFVEARPQGLEKVICETVGLKFSASLDDFSNRPPSDTFMVNLDKAYEEMCSKPPTTAKRLLSELKTMRLSGKLPTNSRVVR